MPTVEVEAIITTSHPMPAYGGVQLDGRVLNQMAAALRSGALPMLMHHDLRRPLDAQVLDARVRDRRDGYQEVWARFVVDVDKWEAVEREREAVSAPGGFSFSCCEPLTVLEPTGAAPNRELMLAADASHWSDVELLSAAEILRAVGRVNVARRFEFAHDPGAVVVLELAGTISAGVLANLVYDTLKRLLRPGRPTTFHFHVEEPDGRVVNARLETDDVAALQSAIETFDQLVAPSKLFVWDEKEEQWKSM